MIEGDDPADGVWMSKAQLAEVRRTSIAAADRLIRRHGWRKEPGNDGRARVLVPRSWTQSSSPSPTARKSPDSAVKAGNPTDNDHRTEAAFEAAILAWQDRALTAEARVAVADARADRAEGRAEAAEGRADRAEAETREARTRLDWAEVQAAAERSRADRAVAGLIAKQTARAAAEALRQAGQERRSRGVLARLWPLWRGK
jgi:hypothetical protein